MPKKLLALCTVLFLIIAALWYFVWKDYDFSIEFTTKASPALSWSKLTSWDFQKINLLEQKKKRVFEELFQEVKLDSTTISLTWNILKGKDSITKIKLGARNPESAFSHRVKLLLGNDHLRKQIKQEASLIKKSLDADAEATEVRLQGEGFSPEAFCACISNQSKTKEKALEMMATIDHLSSFVVQHDLETKGRPRVEITKWDLQNDEITFNFCFPVKKTTPLPEHPFIFFKTMPAIHSLKAVFNGDYRYSHYAWYELLNDARKNGKEVLYTPLEVFHNNPTLGGNPKDWKTDIYLPLK